MHRFGFISHIPHNSLTELSTFLVNSWGTGVAPTTSCGMAALPATIRTRPGHLWLRGGAMGACGAAPHESSRRLHLETVQCRRRADGLAVRGTVSRAPFETGACTHASVSRSALQYRCRRQLCACYLLILPQQRPLSHDLHSLGRR